MTQEEEWQSWRDGFDQIHNGIVRLFHDRAIWRTILAMLDANPAVKRGGFGEYWLGSCFTDSLLIGIRRETADDSRGIGMLRLLAKLEGKPGIATRTWYEAEIRKTPQSSWDASELAVLDAMFNRFASQGMPCVDRNLIRQDIAKLREVLGRVNTYTNKVIAHRDAAIARGTTAAIPVTWRELDESLDAVGLMHKKYYSLAHPGEALGGLTPLVPAQWVQMFMTAWMPDRFTMPYPMDFDPPGLHGT